jgi:hypothetical protein
MSDTAVAVEQAVEQAFGDSAAPVAAPPVVRRDDVKAQIADRAWLDEDGLQAQRDGTLEEGAPDADAAAPDAVTTEGAPAPDAQPDAGEAPPPEAVLDDGAGRIFVRNGDGTFAPAPAVKLEFAVGDKVYLKTPAELVRMARDGVAGQRAQQEVQAYREQLPVLAARLQEMEQELEAQAALSREMLEDEASYFARREQWTQLNSPEQRLARIEQQRLEEMQSRRASEEEAQRTAVVQQYYAQELQPLQDELLGGYQQVPLEAKLGRITMDVMPLLRNGVVPPERLPEYKAYLAGPFRMWVQSEAAKMAQMTQAQQQQLQATVAQERRRAQQVVQSVGKQLAPSGRAAPDTPPPPRPPRTREEAKQMIISRPWDG